MHDRLRVHDDLDLLGPEIEQPPRFDDFQGLIHHGGGVDRDLLAHLPGGVVQRLFDGHSS